MSQTSIDKEKGERFEHALPDALDDSFVHDDKILKKALFKVDLWILTTVTIAYLLNFLDR
jgi:hypothetical protein